MKMGLEYSDLSFNMRVRGNDHSVLDKTMICHLLIGKMRSYGYGRILMDFLSLKIHFWTLSVYKVYSHNRV
jgi:hypothetical protein